jgi:tetratricopeptide (TPR) repeat protein
MSMQRVLKESRQLVKCSDWSSILSLTDGIFQQDILCVRGLALLKLSRLLEAIECFHSALPVKDAQIGVIKTWDAMNEQQRQDSANEWMIDVFSGVRLAQLYKALKLWDRELEVLENIEEEKEKERYVVMRLLEIKGDRDQGLLWKAFLIDFDFRVLEKIATAVMEQANCAKTEQEFFEGLGVLRKYCFSAMNLAHLNMDVVRTGLNFILQADINLVYEKESHILQLRDMASRAVSMFPSLMPIGWICLTLAEFLRTGGTDCDVELMNYYSDFREINQNPIVKIHALCCLARAAWRNPKAVKDYVVQGLRLLKDWSDTSVDFRRKSTSEHLQISLAQMYNRSIFKKEKEKGFELFKKLSRSIQTQALKTDALIGLADSALNIGDVNLAKSVVENELVPNVSLYFDRVKSIIYSLHGWIKQEMGDYEGAIQSILKAIELSNSFEEYYDISALNSLRLGICYWKSGGELRSDRKNCYSCLMNATALDKQQKLSDPHAYLGLYNLLECDDSVSAQRCFQSSLEIYPANKIAADGLVKILEERGLFSTIEEVLLKFVEADSNIAWVWEKLAQIAKDRDDTDQAVFYLQKALVCEPDAALLWGELGDAYRRQGKFLAGIRTLTKAVSLDTKKEYPYLVFQLASLKIFFGIRQEAIVELEGSLQAIKDSHEEPRRKESLKVPIMKLLSDAFLEEGTLLLNTGDFPKSLKSLESALESINSSIDASDVSSICLSKAKADVLAALCNHPLTASDPNTRKKYFELASIALEECIKMNEGGASLWFDLSWIYYKLSLLELDQESVILKRKALKTIQKAISLDKSNSKYWGVASLYIDEENIFEKQHCLLKAIELNPKESLCWNLYGFFLLKHLDFELAKECFLISQSISPNSINVWLGLAMIVMHEHNEERAMEYLIRAKEINPSIFNLLNVSIQ